MTKQFHYWLRWIQVFALALLGVYVWWHVLLR